MADPFKGAKLSLNRADELISDLNTKARAFFKTRPYTSIVEADANGTHHIYKLRLTHPIPDIFTAIAGDAIQNLRDVLDKTVYAIGARVSGTKPFPGQFAFPFARGLDDLEKQIKGRCSGLPAEVQNFIRALKPYKGGNDLLWTLNHIANVKKHALTIEIDGLVSEPLIRKMFAHGKGRLAIQIGPFVWDRVKNEMVVARIPGNADVHYAEVEFGFSVAFDEITFMSGHPAPRVLHAMAREVERILMGLEAESRRLGII